MGQLHWGTALLVAGDFNSNLAKPEGSEGYDEISVSVVTAGLDYMSGNFLLRHIPWVQDGRTWSMQRQGWEVQSWTDSILGKDCRLLYKVSIRDPRHKTDNYMILGCLCGDVKREHNGYLGRRMCLPLRPTKVP